MIDPVVMASSTRKDRTPVKIAPTLQTGFHVSGWKLLMERQMGVLISKRPVGVTIRISGGA